MLPSTPKRSAMDLIRSGRNVPVHRGPQEKAIGWGQEAPSVSIYATLTSKSKDIAVTSLVTFPAAPPNSGGSCAITLIVWASCVLPVRNSPYTVKLSTLRDTGQIGIAWYPLIWTVTWYHLRNANVKIDHLKSDIYAPPKIVSTSLLPVLIDITLLRLSCTSTPVANEEPWHTFRKETDGCNRETRHTRIFCAAS